MKDPHDTVTIEIERTRITQEQMLALMARAADEQRELIDELDIAPMSLSQYNDPVRN